MPPTTKGHRTKQDVHTVHAHIAPHQLAEQIRNGSYQSLVQVLAVWIEPDFQLSLLHLPLVEAVLVYLEEQTIPMIEGNLGKDYMKITKVVDAYLAAFATVLNCIGTNAGLSEHLKTEIRDLFLKHTPRILRWCLFFSQDVKRMLVTADAIHSFCRPVEKLGHIIIKTSLIDSALYDTIYLSGDSIEAMINLWNHFDPRTGDPPVYMEDGTVIQFLEYFPTFVARATDIPGSNFSSILSSLPHTTIKRMVQVLDFRLRSIRVTQSNALNLYARMREVLEMIHRDPRVLRHLDRFMDWGVLVTAACSVFEHRRLASSADLPTEDKHDPAANPFASLADIALVTTLFGDGIVNRITQLCTTAVGAEDSRLSSAPFRTKNLFDLISLAFKWPETDKSAKFVKRALVTFESYSVYPPIARAMLNALNAIAREDQARMANHSQFGVLWRDFDTWIRRKSSIYQRFFNDARELSRVPTMCDNLNVSITYALPIIGIEDLASSTFVTIVVFPPN
ncbi:hypothetical protein H1R20_g13527, partial [Candolleomyces eurysporus]